MPRAEKKYHFIYKTTNLLSGKYYIGMHSTDDLNDGYMGSGKRLRRSLNKYGKENHKVEILEYFTNRKELAEREKEVVCLDEIAKEACMNLKVGGEGGLGFISVEQQRHRSLCAALARKNKIETDSEFRNDLYRKITNGLKLAHLNGKFKNGPPTFNGKIHTDETKLKMSKSSKGKGIGETNSQHGTCWITKDGVNKKIKLEALHTYVVDGWIKGRK